MNFVLKTFSYEEWRHRIVNLQVTPQMLIVILTIDFVLNGWRLTRIKYCEMLLQGVTLPIGGNDSHLLWFMANPLHYVLARLLGVQSLQGYVLYCIAQILLLYVVAVWLTRWALRKYPEHANLVTLMVLMHPVFYVLRTWVGGYDVLAIMAIFFLVFSTNPVVWFVACFCAYPSHPVAVIGACCLFLLHYFSPTGQLKPKKTWITLGACMVVGLLLGYIASRLVWIYWYNQVPQSRSGFVTDQLTIVSVFRYFINNFSSQLYTMLMTLWLPFIAAIFFFLKEKKYRGYAYIACLEMLGVYIIAIPGIDRTRNLTFISVAITMHVLVTGYREFVLERQSVPATEGAVRPRHPWQVIFYASVMLAVFAPHFYVFEDTLYSSPLHLFLFALAQLFLDWSPAYR